MEAASQNNHGIIRFLDELEGDKHVPRAARPARRRYGERKDAGTPLCPHA